MRRVIGGMAALVLVGCSKPAEKPADTTMGEAPMAAETAPASMLSDMAGNWNVHSTVEGSDKAVDYEMVTTADQSGWSIKFPGREPIPVRVVAVEGDSVITEAGPFESQLRKGVQVSTRVVARMQDGKLVGTTRARYDVSGPATVAVLRFEGTRAP